MFMFALSSESRPLEYPFLQRKNLTRRALRELFENSKRLKVGLRMKLTLLAVLMTTPSEKVLEGLTLTTTLRISVS
jgi:hypothetical protein